MDNVLMESNIQNMLKESVTFGRTKYAPYIQEAEKAYFESKGTKMPLHLQTSLVRNLMNTEVEFESKGYDTAKYIKEETTPGDVSAFIHHAFDMVTSIIPNSVMEEFLTIQSLDKRVGEVFFMDIVTGSTKAPYGTAPQSYLSSQTGPRTGQNYSDDRILGETVGTVADGSTTAVFTGTVAWTPLKATSESIFDKATGLVPVRATFKFTSGDVEYQAQVNVAGSLYTAVAGVTSATLTTAGVATLTLTGGTIADLGTYVTVDYEYNSTDITASAQSGKGLPEVDIRVTSALVTAKRRALKTKWLLDSAAMLSKEHGKDIEKELLDAVIAGVMNEQAVEMAADIYNAATAGSVQFSKTPPSTQIPYIVHRQELLGKVVEQDINIETAVRKIKANFVIGGSDFCNVVRGMPVDLFKPADYSDAVPVGMHVIGKLNNQYKIIQNFDFTHDVFVTGGKGNSWLLTGAIFAPFIPLMTTKPITDENLNTFRSLLTYYGKKIINSNFYSKGQITA